MTSFKQELQGLINKNKAKYVEIDEQIAQGVLNSKLDWSHDFLTVFNLKEYKFTVVKNLKEILGYNEEEFTIEKLTDPFEVVNQPFGIKKKETFHKPRYIVHEEDVELVLIFGLIAYRILIAPQFNFIPLRDSYQVRFRVFDKNGQKVRLTRRCFLYEFEEFVYEDKTYYTPVSHIDIWTANYEDVENSNVECTIISSDVDTIKAREREGQLNKAFRDILFQEYLGFRLTKRQVDIAKLLIKGETYEDIGRHLDISTNTVKDHLSTIKKRINAFLNQHSFDPINNSIKLGHFIKKYKLLESIFPPE